MVIREDIRLPEYSFSAEEMRALPEGSSASFCLHNRYQLYYQLQGVSRCFIQDRPYLIRPGFLCLIFPDEITYSLAEGPKEGKAWKRYEFRFQEHVLLPLAQVLGIGTLSEIFGERRMLAVPVAIQKEVEGYFQRAGKWDGPELGPSQKLAAAELLFLFLRLPEVVEQEPPVLSPKEKTVQQISVYLTEHYRRQVGLPELAEQFDLSTYYLSHLFKDVSGINVMEYLNSVRLREARRLLENTLTPVTEIASASGFSTPAHFSRVFKMETGLSPKQYRDFLNRPPFPSLSCSEIACASARSREA